MTMQMRLEEVRTRIAAACERVGRKPDDITIVAVTKYSPLKAAEEALSLGLQQLGENRWQDARDKWEAIGDRAVWHFIGSLQTNKVKDVVGRFDYIHSVDRLALAEELERKAAAKGLRVKVFLQVNVSGEASKHGASPAELEALARQVAGMPHLEVAGLMTMAPFDLDAESARPVFAGLRQLRDGLNAQKIFAYELKHLSMGMSGDFETAIEEGATFIRLGTVLVGGRT